MTNHFMTDSFQVPSIFQHPIIRIPCFEGQGEYAKLLRHRALTVYNRSFMPLANSTPLPYSLTAWA